jgi:hypothetical protein
VDNGLDFSIFGAVGVDVVVVAGTSRARDGARGSGPGGDARAATPTRPVRTSTPGTTFSSTITAGHMLESNGCGTLLPLTGRVPQPWANRGLMLGGWREETLPGRPPGPVFTRTARLIRDNPGKSVVTARMLHPIESPGISRLADSNDLTRYRGWDNQLYIPAR